jgi:hypothetical protein
MQPTHKESPRGADSPNGHPSSPISKIKNPKESQKKIEETRFRKQTLGKHNSEEI